LEVQNERLADLVLDGSFELAGGLLGVFGCNLADILMKRSPAPAGSRLK
jgi:hypothetical protein